MLPQNSTNISLMIISLKRIRGAQAADHCIAQLPDILARHLGASLSPHAALKATFADLEQGYRVVWEADCSSRLMHGKAGGLFPGCTALVALLSGRDLYVANAGKSGVAFSHLCSYLFASIISAHFLALTMSIIVTISSGMFFLIMSRGLSSGSLSWHWRQ